MTHLESNGGRERERSASLAGDDPEPMNVVVVLGTRPEAIKLAPVISALRSRDEIRCRLCVTAQHREMLHQALARFEIDPDIDLDLMAQDQRPLDFFAKASTALQSELERLKPDLVIVQGDTVTCFSAALAAFLSRIPVMHVEAGLRTHDRGAPFPEELLRRMVSDVAEYHAAPTRRAKENLLAEGLPADRIWVTGNTIVDALESMAGWLSEKGPGVFRQFGLRERFVLITGHRRENFGEPFRRIFQALKRLALEHPEVDFIYPVHPNPSVSLPAHESLSGLANMKLVQPVDYLTFLSLMAACEFVISDSGGVQEEAPSLGKRVLVTREVTERPELIESGLGKLVGSDAGRLYQEGHALLSLGPESGGAEASANPFGDGSASDRIVDILLSGKCQEFSPGEPAGGV
jgi:UDP-N-acetylglucosamine 2-epimerase